MPRPKTPTAKARLTGADKKHPDRFKNRAEPATQGRPIGEPLAYMDKEAKAAWRELARNLGWLEIEDRGAVEVASLAMGALRATVKAGELPTAALVSASRQALAALGATPADRSKVHVSGDDDTDDPFARFGMQ
jgi:phage terminase small subunit